MYLPHMKGTHVVRRFFLLFIAIALFPLAGLCETGAQRLSTLDIISQRDPRLADEPYYYQDMMFRIGGCKPASIANGLVALLGDAQTDVPQLLIELRDGLKAIPGDKKSGIDILKLPTFLSKPRDSAVTVKELLKGVSSIIYLDSRTGNVTPAYFLTKHLSSPDAHPLFIREFTTQKNWHWMLDLAARLCEMGHPDARFVLSAASAGTDETDAPLRSGKGGHYVTLYFQAEEFHRDGTMYLLDSLPRALPGDVYGFFEHYPSQYPFTTRRTDPFGKTYDATRIIDTVLQFTLKPSEREKLSSLNPNSAAWTALRQKQVETLTLYVKSTFMLYIP